MYLDWSFGLSQQNFDLNTYLSTHLNQSLAELTWLKLTWFAKKRKH